MPVNFVRSNPHVRENIGKIAVMRGPVVYCAEVEDNGRGFFRFHAGNPNYIVFRHEKGLLEYAWANRGAGEMTVWINK